jgi:hypothetical protein
MGVVDPVGVEDGFNGDETRGADPDDSGKEDVRAIGVALGEDMVI